MVECGRVWQNGFLQWAMRREWQEIIGRECEEMGGYRKEVGDHRKMEDL